MQHNPNLPFTADEYRIRVEKTLEAMHSKGLDGLMIHSPENIYYLTGYHSVGYFTYTALILTSKGATCIVARNLLSSMVKHTSWVDDFQGWTDIQDPIATTRIALDSAGLIGKNVGYDQQAWFYNIGHHNALIASCGGHELRGDCRPRRGCPPIQVAAGDRVHPGSGADLQGRHAGLHRRYRRGRH